MCICWSAEAEEAKDDLRSTLGEEPLNTLDQADEYLSLSGNDINFALAKLRMDLERRLREILGKRITTSAPQDMKGQFLSAETYLSSLREIPKYKTCKLHLIMFLRFVMRLSMDKPYLTGMA